MGHRTRKLLLWLGIPLVVVILALAGVVAGLKSAPSFYQPVAMGSADFDAAAKRVEDKLIELRNVALETHAARSNSRPPTATQYVISFTQEELNAFMLKWTELNALRGQYERWIRQPMLAFMPGRIIFAAETTTGPTRCVVSLHAAATLDPAGPLRLSIDRLQAGQLTLPHTLWAEYTSDLAKGVERQLPAWRSAARLDRNGAANESAVKAAYGQLLLSALSASPNEAVLIIPVRSDRGIPVRVVDLVVAKGKITLTVIPLTAAESEAFLARLKSPS